MYKQNSKDYLPMWLREREIETRQVEPMDLLKQKNYLLTGALG